MAEKLTIRNQYGSIDKQKARLIAKGYVQQEGTNYEETFTPKAKLITMNFSAYLVGNSWPCASSEYVNTRGGALSIEIPTKSRRPKILEN
jgi:hypothetical protein